LARGTADDGVNARVQIVRPDARIPRDWDRRRPWTGTVIADALFISLPTVKVHVTHLFAKLGVDSRVAAAAFAHRHDLT